MAKARIRDGETLLRMKRRELEEAIYEANLGQEDTMIATRYFIDRIPQIDIAFELSNRNGMEMSRSAVSRRISEIRKRLCT